MYVKLIEKDDGGRERERMRREAAEGVQCIVQLIKRLNEKQTR
jgi:hypothetical protein